jgi:molybdopterin synthase sulfur carrier subunit
MARISFTENLRRHVPCPPVDAHGATVRELLDAVFADNPQLRSYLLDDQGRLRKHVNVFVNDLPAADRIFLSDPVGTGDQVFVFQALSGG